jgi:hypothetical protein
VWNAAGPAPFVQMYALRSCTADRFTHTDPWEPRTSWPGSSRLTRAPLRA